MAPRKYYHTTTPQQPKVAPAVYKTEPCPEDRTAVILLANVMLERDALIAKCNEYKIERAEFQHTAAKYCMERAEMTLEMNFARESILQNRMMMESEQHEVNIGRFQLLQQHERLQGIMRNIKFSHGM
jgi:hypothetical protein